MKTLFEGVLSLGFSAGCLILAVVLLRLILFRAPKWTRCGLWALVGLRLAVPFSLESPWSLVPRFPQTAQPVILEKEIDFIVELPQATGMGGAFHGVATADGPAAGPELLSVLSWVWLAGVLLLLGYALVSVLRLRRRVAEAVPLKGNVWQCDLVDTPFLLGVLRPRIYLPSDLPQEALEPVLAHENAHLARLDHWWKPLAFLLLAVYWFHPLVWLAYGLFCRDLELACDERAIRDLDGAGRKAYSLALLTCSTEKRSLAACPLAFGEGGVKGRVKAVLGYKRPAFWLVLAAAAACAAAAVCFFTQPVRHPTLEWAQSLTAEQVTAVDLVVLPQDKPYKQLAPEEIPAVVELLRQSRGSPVKEPEALDGQSIWFSLTLTDGTKHTVGNLGNVYLVIDGDYYDAPYGWLASWCDAYGAGDAPLPEGYFDRTLTLEDVLALSEKGEAFTWTDLDGFTYTETGSGLYIRICPVEGPYTLSVGGAGPSGWMMYAILSCDDFVESVDIRAADVAAFLQAQEERRTRLTELFAAVASSPAASSSPGDYLDAHPEEHQALLDGGRDTLCYIFAKFLAGGQTGLEGQLMRAVLDELAPEARLKLAADTGQAYFDAWRVCAEGALEEHGAEWMEEHQPAMWLMLQMSQAEL